MAKKINFEFGLNFIQTLVGIIDMATILFQRDF